MLIRFFKSSFYSQYLLLIAIAVALWTKAVLDPCHIVSGEESIVFNLIFSLIGSQHIVSTTLAILIMIFSAVLLNFVLVRHELLPKNSMLGALVYVILMSNTPVAIGLNPVLLASLFIIPAFDQIMLTYGKPDPTQQVFTASFLLAIASLIYFPAIVLLLLLIFSLLVFQTLSFRILLVSLTGAFAVYLYLFLFYFMSDSMEGQFWLYIEWFSTLPVFTLPPISVNYGIWILILLLFVTALMHIFSQLNEGNISVRKKMLLNLWFLLLVMITLVFESDLLNIAIFFLAIPLTTIIASYLALRKKASLWMELYIILLILAIFVNNTFIGVC